MKYRIKYFVLISTRIEIYFIKKHMNNTMILSKQLSKNASLRRNRIKQINVIYTDQ